MTIPLPIDLAALSMPVNIPSVLELASEESLELACFDSYHPSLCAGTAAGGAGG